MLKRLVDNALHKHYGINQKKDCQPHKFGSNNVCVVSLTKFYIFLNYVNLDHFREKKNANDQNSFNFMSGLDKGLYCNSDMKIVVFHSEKSFKLTLFNFTVLLLKIIKGFMALCYCCSKYFIVFNLNNYIKDMLVYQVLLCKNPFISLNPHPL